MGIYLDHAATTYTDKRVLEAMLPYFGDTFGNPSSLHTYGRVAEKGIGIARRQTADAIGAKKNEIYFTSGGTESDNWAIIGAVEAAGAGHIITTNVEHHAVLDTCKYLEKRGFSVTYLAVDETGMVSAQSVADAIREDTILITIMAANNETGTLMPIEAIGKIAKQRGILFHTDAVQAVGHIAIDVDEMNIDLLSLSAHKFYGPKGVGALYVRQGTKIDKYMHGGAQEKGMRGSTLNAPGIVGLGAAITLAAKDMQKHNDAEAAMAKQLMDGLLMLPQTRLNGHASQRLPGTVNITFDAIEAEALMIYLDMEGIAVSTGSACTSGSTGPSYVLLAMGLNNTDARGAVRFTMGRENTPEQIDTVIKTTTKVVESLREISPLFAQSNGGNNMYNEKVMEHFKNPQNVGEMENPDGYAEVGSSQCGDTMKMYLRIEDDKITDIKYKTYGCCAAIASSSIATEMAKGRTVADAEAMSKSDIVAELGGLPEKKIHCSLLAEDALKAALQDYKSKKQV